MIKKIALTFTICSLTFIQAAEHKQAPTSAAQTKPSISLTGALPFQFAAPDLVQFAQVLSKSDALERATAALGEKLNLKEAAQALANSEALENAVDKLKDVKIDITSEVLKEAAQALSTIKIEGKPTLKHELTHNHNLQVPDIDQLATRGFGGVAFIYALIHGANPVITGCLGCLTFAPYPMIKEISWKGYSYLKKQMSRCFTHKNRHSKAVLPLEIDLEATSKALVKRD